MKNFLLTESLEIVRISTALYTRVEQGQWTNVFEKELDNFTKVLEEVMNEVSDTNRRAKLESFGTGEKLKERVR